MADRLDLDAIRSTLDYEVIHALCGEVERLRAVAEAARAVASSNEGLLSCADLEDGGSAKCPACRLINALRALDGD